MVKKNSKIVIEHVSKKYGENMVLDDISLEFESGKIYGLVGRNGCGKTMLMKCICGFVKPSAGRVIVNDKEVGKEIDVPEDIGIIIENPGFVSNYSGYKNLKLLASVNRKIKKEEILKYMEMVGLDPKSKKHVGKYSLGMRQKLGIAQAIMENPSIIILDEPMNGLDNVSVEKVREMLKKVVEEDTLIILASHNHEDIDTLCNIVYHMDNGKITEIEILD